MQNTNQTQNDLSLLRKFNLEAAKAGEEFCFVEGGNMKDRKFIAGPDRDGKIVVQDEFGNFSMSFSYPYNMKPLCWVENLPVYKGDVLWYAGFSIKVEGYNPHVEDKTGLIGVIVEAHNINFTVGEQSWAPFGAWSWNKPKQKVKRKVWINVYPGDFSTVYPSKEDADYSMMESRIACVETEIEYEV